MKTDSLIPLVGVLIIAAGAGLLWRADHPPQKNWAGLLTALPCQNVSSVVPNPAAAINAPGTDLLAVTPNKKPLLCSDGYVYWK